VRNTEGRLFSTNDALRCGCLWVINSYRMSHTENFGVGRYVCAGQNGVLNLIVLKYWSESLRLRKFSIPEGVTSRKGGFEMKPRGSKCDSPIEDLPWCTCVSQAISTGFQEVNLGSYGKNLSEPLDQTMFACVILSISWVVLPCHDEEYHSWDALGNHVFNTYPGSRICQSDRH
jgi:hypothetical protein